MGALPPSPDVLLHAEQQAANFQDARRQTGLLVPEEGGQAPRLRRHRRQAAGRETGAANGFEEHAQTAQEGVESIWRKSLRRRRQRKDYPGVFDRRAEDRRQGFEGAASGREGCRRPRRWRKEEKEEGRRVRRGRRHQCGEKENVKPWG